MKTQITILAMILGVSLAYSQERTRSYNTNSERSPRVHSEKNKSGINTSGSSSRKYSDNTATRTTSVSPATTKSNSVNERQHHATERTRYAEPANVATRHRHTDSKKVVHSKHSYKGHYESLYYRPTRAHTSIYVDFTPTVRRTYIDLYPRVDFSRYPTGYRIPYITAYKARYYTNNLASVYGVVNDVYYSRQYDEYYIYVGQHYPRHDFCIVMPGHIARKYSYHPANYFLHNDICVTGYITTFQGKPEMVVKRSSQIHYM